jgi:hypothetical protein
MCKVHIDGDIGALLLDEEDEEGDDDNKGDVIGRCHGRETTVVTRPLPPDSSAEILENAEDDGGGDQHVIADSGGHRALCEHDAIGRPDNAVAQEMSRDSNALAVTDGILARWSAQGLSVHASWAPAYADTQP